MNSIVKAKEEDYRLLSEIGSVSFIESHGRSASEKDINDYLKANYNYEAFKKELADPKNIYHILYCDNKPAGFSKIIINSPHANIRINDVTKMDRLYLLKEFQGLRSGLELLNFNVELSKQKNQAGMWLFVWKENHKAVRFYERAGFRIIGSYDFKLTETHSNPNHQMLLIYRND